MQRDDGYSSKPGIVIVERVCGVLCALNLDGLRKNEIIRASCLVCKKTSLTPKVFKLKL